MEKNDKYEGYAIDDIRIADKPEHMEDKDDIMKEFYNKLLWRKGRCFYFFFTPGTLLCSRAIMLRNSIRDRLSLVATFLRKLRDWEVATQMYREGNHQPQKLTHSYFRLLSITTETQLTSISGHTF